MNVNSIEEGERLGEAEVAERLAHTRETLRKSGAHYVIDTFDQLPEVVADVNERLARGERP